jgi:hypothetical protein
VSESKIWYNKLEMICGHIVEETEYKIVIQRRDKVIEINRKDINRIERGS